MRRRLHLAHALWILVLIKCVTPPLFITPFSVLHREPQVPAVVDVLVASYVPHFVPAAHQRPIEVVSEPEVDAVPATAAGPFSQVSFDWQAWAIPAWIAGMLAFLLIAMKRWYACYREVRGSSVPADSELEGLVKQLRGRLGVRRRFRLCVSRSAIGPFVFGFWRPTIVIPQQLIEGNLKDVEPIVAHEIVHVRRGDTLFGILQFVTQMIWWFHPLVWWANRQANRTCEQCCDEEVVAGFWSQQSFVADKDLENVRQETRFAKLAERAKPPAKRTAYRQFDFWIGSWEVVGRTGKKIGHYSGAFQDGKMQLVGERILANGQKGLTRVSFTPLPGNQVQQFIEQSPDNGKTWTTYFNGTYVRKAKTG